jgi:aminoglycoside phosphotransferase (APT) family kinase protein
MNEGRSVPSTGSGVEPLRREMLARALAVGAAAPVKVLSIKLAAGGNSRETWIAEVGIDGSARRVVFRCDPDQWIRPKEMRREIDGLRLAARAGVAVPAVLASSLEIDVGRPFVITEYIEGTTLARRVLRDDDFAAARRGFARQCGEILAKLHGAASLAQGWAPYDPIEELNRYASDSVYSSPVFQGARRWLLLNRPAPRAVPSPVHRDFRLGNLMIREDGIVAVLDWETCELGEAEEDLAWLCSRSWRYGSELPVGGLGTMEDLFQSYERCSGRRIDIERFHWWSVYAETRWGLAGTVRQRPGSAGDLMEQAAVARRGCRQEYNVLQELARFVTA